MTLRPLMLPIATLALLLAAGCSTLTGGACHKQQEYEQAQNLPPLRVPAGLDSPETEGALAIPVLNEPEVPLDPEGPCLEAPPALTEPPPPLSDVVLPERDARGRTAAEVQEEDGDRPTRSKRRPPRRPR